MGITYVNGKELVFVPSGTMFVHPDGERYPGLPNPMLTVDHAHCVYVGDQMYVTRESFQTLRERSKAEAKEQLAERDTRPQNCRMRLMAENKAYPKSGCNACSMSIASGMRCPHA